jgi:hypothetical protein
VDITKQGENKMVERTQLTPNQLPHWAKTSAFDFTFASKYIKQMCKTNKIRPKRFAVETSASGDLVVFVWNTTSAYKFTVT